MNLLSKNADKLNIGVILRDLIVVALGILIAISVDGWVKDSEDRREERQILAGLKEELQANRDQLERVSETWSRLRSANQQLLQLIGKDLDDNGVLRVREFAAATNTSSFDPRAGQLKSVISSGKLGLISNTHLRANLADWPDLVDDLLDDWRYIDNFIFPRLDRTLFSVIPYRANSPLESQPDEIFTNVGFENLLQEIEVTFVIIFLETEEIIAATDEIISLIDTELE